MKISEKLQQRLMKDFGFKALTPERLYPGIHQRYEGAWSWMAHLESGGSVGSQWPMKTCAEAVELEVDVSSNDTIDIIPHNFFSIY